MAGEKVKINGYEAYQWPEFKALCARLGIPHDLATKDITITFTAEEVIVNHNYRATATLDEQGRRCGQSLDEIEDEPLVPVKTLNGPSMVDYGNIPAKAPFGIPDNLPPKEGKDGAG